MFELDQVHQPCCVTWQIGTFVWHDYHSLQNGELFSVISYVRATMHDYSFIGS